MENLILDRRSESTETKSHLMFLVYKAGCNILEKFAFGFDDTF